MPPCAAARSGPWRDLASRPTEAVRCQCLSDKDGMRAGGAPALPISLGQPCQRNDQRQLLLPGPRSATALWSRANACAIIAPASCAGHASTAGREEEIAGRDPATRREIGHALARASFMPLPSDSEQPSIDRTYIRPYAVRRGPEPTARAARAAPRRAREKLSCQLTAVTPAALLHEQSVSSIRPARSPLFPALVSA